MEYVYSTEPLLSAYHYRGLQSIFLVTLFSFLFTLMVCLLLVISVRSRFIMVLAVLTFFVYPSFWVYKSTTVQPFPNIPVIGTIDSWSESTEMVRVNKHRTEPQWRGYMIYRVDNVRYPVKIVPGRTLPERAVFYKNPRDLVEKQ